MDDILSRFWADLAGRVSGPMSLRLILQPAVATFLAIRAGMQDAREGHPLYGWSIATDSAHRIELLQEGWKAVAKVYVLAVVLDFVYQFIVSRWINPVESLVVAFLLAFLPYLLIRGPANRLMRLRRPRERGRIA